MLREKEMDFEMHENSILVTQSSPRNDVGEDQAVAENNYFQSSIRGLKKKKNRRPS